ncbi:UNVERIFIED_CONTAM: hypothetical protein ABID98_000536 [Brevibacillus sp. OAP136]
MSTTELRLEKSFEKRVLRTLQSNFRRNNPVLLRESLWANGLSHEQVDFVMSLLERDQTVSEIMEALREQGAF